MSHAPHKKKGMLDRFSAFLKSDTFTIGTPSPSPTRAPPQIQQQQQQHQDPRNGSLTQKRSFSSVDDALATTVGSSSPAIGPLELGSNSFASSTANSLQPMRSEDDGTSSAGNDNGSSDGGAVAIANNSNNNNNNNSNSNQNNDAFRLFSIVGPAFGGHSFSGDASAAGAANNGAGDGTAASMTRRRGASAFIPARNAGAGPFHNNDVSKNPGEAHHHHHQHQQESHDGSEQQKKTETVSAAAGGGEERDEDDDAEEEEKRKKRRDERLARLQSFFEQEDLARRALDTNCSVSPAKQRDILARVAESEHDIDFAISTLKSAYGIDRKKEQQQQQSNQQEKLSSPASSPIQQQRDGIPSAAAPAVLTPHSLGRRRSFTIARGDLVTLLGPLLPPDLGKAVISTAASAAGPAAPEAETNRSSEPIETKLSGKDGQAAAAAEALPPSPASVKRVLSDADEQQKPRGKTINTGNVHGNRYVAVDATALPHPWFYFGGEPVAIDYRQNMAAFGSTTTLHSSAVPAPSDKVQCPRQLELSAEADDALMELIRLQIAAADKNVMRASSPCSSLSSEMSGRSFGDMVDLEDMVRSLM